jgi:hypothetical protein
MIFWAREDLFDLFQLINDLSFVKNCSSDYQFNILYQEVSIICFQKFRYVTSHIFKCLLTIRNNFISINHIIFVKFRIFCFDFLKVLIKDFWVLKGEYFGSNFLEVFQRWRETAQVSNFSLSVILGIVFEILDKRSFLTELTEIIKERLYLSDSLNYLLCLCNLWIDDSHDHLRILKVIILFPFHIKHSPDIFDKSILLNVIEVLYFKQLFDWELFFP